MQNPPPFGFKKKENYLEKRSEKQCQVLDKSLEVKKIYSHALPRNVTVKYKIFARKRLACSSLLPAEYASGILILKGSIPCMKTKSN